MYPWISNLPSGRWFLCLLAYIGLTCIVVTLPVTAQSLPPELAEFRQRVLAHTQQQRAAVSLREAQPGNVANPDNPVDFVGIVHNQILAEGLKVLHQPNARGLQGDNLLVHWQDTAQTYLAALVPSQQSGTLRTVAKKTCKIDPFHPWRCNIWKPRPEPGDPLEKTVLWRTTENESEEESQTKEIAALAEDLYGSVHPGQVAFAIEVLGELKMLTESASDLQSYISSVKALERRILDSHLMTREEKLPLLGATATARYSFAFGSQNLKVNPGSVVKSDFIGALGGANLGVKVGGIWGLGIGAVLGGGIASGLDYWAQTEEENQATALLNPNPAWTPWLNRDSPGGSGDYETLREFVAAGQACDNPTAIQCQTVDGRSWQELGRPYTCDTQTGGVCRKANQADGRCPDFRVRFRCD